MYRIMGKYQNLPEEEIDTADDKDEVEYLLGEYRLAYRGWKLWIEED